LSVELETKIGLRLGAVCFSWFLGGFTQNHRGFCVWVFAVCLNDQTPPPPLG